MDAGSPSPERPTRSRPARSRRSFLVASASVVVLGGAGALTATGVVSAAGRAPGRPSAAPRFADRSAVPASGRLFSPDSPWNTKIPADPVIDPRSPLISKQVLQNRALVVNTILYSYGVPFYTATASTPQVVLKGRGGIGAPIPLDPSWRPNEGADGKMNVLDPAAGVVYELQGYDRARRTVYWMVVRDTVTGNGDGSASRGRQGPTGSGLTQAGGVIRLEEVRAGRIDHALSFITSNPAKGRFRYPATHTDGTSTASGAIAEGMRVQLDPSLDLGALGLGRAEYAIGRALQLYGAYCTDNGRGNNMAMGFYAEKPTSPSADIYRGAGLVGDWAQLTRIPRSAYRVLAESVTRP